MSRNEKCFCGSGLKKKKCHGDIHDNSLVANVLKIYSKLDKKIKDNIRFKCMDNCNKCCYDYFYISEEEFLVIMYYIEKNFSKEKLKEIFIKANEYMSNLKENHKEEYNNLNNITYGLVKYKGYEMLKFIPRATRTEKACVFLEDGKCLIYEVRPFICRNYGTLSKKFTCNDIIIEKDEFEYELLDKLLDKRIKHEYESFLGRVYYEREYPISDFIVSLYDTYKKNGKLNHAIKSDRGILVKNKINRNMKNIST